MDEWPLMSKLAMPTGQTAIVSKQHTTTAERCEAARALRDTYAHRLDPMRLVVDPVGEFGQDGEVFSKLLNPWPTRFYIMTPQDQRQPRNAAKLGFQPPNEKSLTTKSPPARAKLPQDTTNTKNFCPQTRTQGRRQGSRKNLGSQGRERTLSRLVLDWVSYFEDDSTIDFSKFSDQVFEALPTAFN